jgi:hypothetical protein
MLITAVVGHPAEDAMVPDIGKKPLSEVATFLPAGLEHSRAIPSVQP